MNGSAQWRCLCAGLAVCLHAFLGTGAETPEPVTVRVLPSAFCTNATPLRLGFQVGLSEGPAEVLCAERFAPEVSAAAFQTRPGMREIRDPETGACSYVFENTAECPSGAVLYARALRRNVNYAVRVACRSLKGSGKLQLQLTPLSGRAKEAWSGWAKIKTQTTGGASFDVTLRRDGDYQCAFLIEPGDRVEFRGFSMVPKDANGVWDSAAMAALKKIGACAMRWPADDGVDFYNWYDGVGSNALRRAEWVGESAAARHVFGTVEFVGFCRLTGAEPVIRVPVFMPGWRNGRVPDQAAAIQMAADWVAYCNATNGHPLAELRRRHGHPEPLDVKRWELTMPEGGAFSAAARAAMFRAYEEAMRREDPDLRIDIVGPGRFAPLEDRYTEPLMRRLASGDAAEAAYYRGWYEALGVANAFLTRLPHGGGGPVCAPFFVERAVSREASAPGLLTEQGLLMAVLNRFPAQPPLAVEGCPADAAAPFKVVAAWTEDPGAIVVFVYNSEAEPHRVRLDLTAFKTRFVFWLSDQLFADILQPRTAEKVRVLHRQKAGSALSQSVLCECPPASLTRVVIKE